MAEEKNRRPYTVLLIEDERPLLEAIKKKLEVFGFFVVTARAVAQAIGYLEDVKNIDVVWLDHYLIGKENGLDFVVRLKSDADWKKIPIFVVSNTSTPEKVESYLRLGISKYYTKSDFRLDEMIGDIKEFLDNSNSQDNNYKDSNL